MLADLIHHVRNELPLPLLSRIVTMYSANTHDPTLAAAIQTMCSKLLHNLVEPIQIKEPGEATKLLQRLSETFICKMEAMAEVRDDWVKWSKPREPLSVVLATIAERAEKANARKAAKVAEVAEDAVMTIEGQAKEGAGEEGDKMDVDSEGTVGKVEGEAKKVDEGAKDDEDDLPPIELDDVDIERAKPIGRTVGMIDVGQDQIKEIGRAHV